MFFIERVSKVSIRFLKLDDMTNKPQLSVIIPTYNRQKKLKLCIYSLIKQDLSAEHYEIVVVDDNSTDNTYKAMEALEKDHKSVQYYRLKKNLGSAAARNFGSVKANGDILVFTDSDCIAPNNFLEKINNFFMKNKDFSTLMGKEVLIFNKWPFKSLSDYYNKKQNSQKKKKKIEKLIPRAHLNSSAFAIRKDSFLSVGGYNEKFKWAGEDHDLEYHLLKNKQQIFFDPDIYVYHHKYDKIITLVNKFYNYEVAETANLKEYFNRSLVIKLPFNKMILKKNVNFTLYIYFGHFEYLTLMFFLLICCPLISAIGILSYAIYVFIKTKNIKMLSSLILYEYITGAASFAGRIAGSIKYKTVYI
jgi:glycosyltransferase involved in cell wall biosynthesis